MNMEDAEWHQMEYSDLENVSLPIYCDEKASCMSVVSAEKNVNIEWVEAYTCMLIISGFVLLSVDKYLVDDA